MDPVTPKMDKLQLAEIRRKTEESVKKAEALAKEAQAKKTLLEETRELYIQLEEEFRTMKRLEVKKKTAKNKKVDDIKREMDLGKYLLSGLVDALIETKGDLKKHEKDYKTIQLRLNLAYQLAKQNEQYLSQETKKLLHLKFQADEEMKKKNLPSNNMAEDVKIPEMDVRALNFFLNLSDRNMQQKFENWRKSFFLKSFGNVKQRMVNTYRHNKEAAGVFPKNHDERKFLYRGMENIEGLIASRMAELVMKERVVGINDEKMKQLRNRALAELEMDQKRILGGENVDAIEMEELERRKNVDEWVGKVVMETALQPSPKPTPRTTTYNKVTKKFENRFSSTVNQSPSVSQAECLQILDRFYEELKTKHINQVDVKQLMSQVIKSNIASKRSNQKPSEVAQSFLLSQLDKMLLHY